MVLSPVKFKIMEKSTAVPSAKVNDLDVDDLINLAKETSYKTCTSMSVMHGFVLCSIKKLCILL